MMLAGANGANDNFKGVATLHGGGTLSYGWTLGLATLATLLGSLYSVYLASGLIQAFHGGGLVTDALADSSRFALAVGVGAAVTVAAASRLGMPVSTTHGLLGAMLGAAMAAGVSPQWATLAGTFVVPLVASPLAAGAFAGVGYFLLNRSGQAAAVSDDDCLCIGDEVVPVVPPSATGLAAATAVISAGVGTKAECDERYGEAAVRLDLRSSVDLVHVLSAAAVSFARGVNDTPKIAALLVLTPLAAAGSGTALVAAAIALGAIVGARRVAETMSFELTSLDPRRGLVANTATALVVLLVSRWGFPASTTHVSSGALFAVGALSGTARSRTISAVVFAWLLTLPVAALVAAGAFSLI